MLNRAVMHGHIDGFTGNRFVGWAFAGRSPATVEASIDGQTVASIMPDHVRHDLIRSFPGEPAAATAGFVLDLPAEAIPDSAIYSVDLHVCPAAVGAGKQLLARFVLAGPKLVETVSAAPPTDIVGPFPRRVIDAVAAVWPDVCQTLSSVVGQQAFVEKLGLMFRTQELRSVPAIADYARYLRSNWAHCKFVESFFPTRNTAAQDNAIDFHCRPNSVFEIFSIIHQLYVLKSYGLDGAFAEFGCFKGFSSAMLSHACKQLGVPMLIFDSFEGLPAVEHSSYQAGQYCGELDEVRDHVTRFGAVDSVEFHKGFFKDTFRSYAPPGLLCLWMDVDLEVSSRDLMVVADRLDPRATMFSHECSADIFQSGAIVTAPHPDNPIPPMLDRFEQLGQPLTGRFLRGNTGAFWPRDGGIPAIDNDVLISLAKFANEIVG